MSDGDKIFEAALKKQYEGVQIFNAKELPKVKSNPTGSLRLDIVLHNPIFNGCLVEIFGNPGSGKTTLALSILNEAVKKNPDRPIFYCDQEHRLQKSLISTFPKLLDKLKMIRAVDGIQALNIIEMYLRQYNEAIIVVDSVDSLLPEDDKSRKDIGDETLGGLPRLMSSACRKLNRAAAISGGTVIFLNQLRSKIGAYGDPDTTSGGKALTFYASQRIKLKDITSASRIKDDAGNIIGHTVRFYIAKNSVTTPFVEGEFPLIYGKGIDSIDEMVDLAGDLAILNKEGNYILLDDKKRPPKFVKDLARSDPDFFQKILKQIHDLYPDTFQ